MENEDKLNIIRPFGPAIGTANIPKTLIDKINNFIDEVIKDKIKSKKFDGGKVWRVKFLKKYYYLKK